MGIYDEERPALDEMLRQLGPDKCLVLEHAGDGIAMGSVYGFRRDPAEVAEARGQRPEPCYAAAPRMGRAS